jgi:hypothetical protein
MLRLALAASVVITVCAPSCQGRSTGQKAETHAPRAPAGQSNEAPSRMPNASTAAAVADQLTPQAETNVDGGGEDRQTAISTYRAELTGWLNRRWRVRGFETLPCKFVRGLRARVEIDQERRRITAARILERSGHTRFDESVQQSLDALVGQEMPGPPNGMEDVLPAKLQTIFSAQTASCTSDDD